MKTKNKFNKGFWEDRYRTGETGWDIGYVSTPLKDYFDQLRDKELQILIPGSGNAYEAEYLYKKGFKNVFVLDISNLALENFKNRVPGFPIENLINEDFFHHSGQFDLIIEQTFFCALDSALRKSYVKKMHQLLKPGGKLVGLLFNVPLNEDKPPFGGSKPVYENLFKDLFHLRVFETAKNSIPQREGSELFMIAVKK